MAGEVYAICPKYTEIDPIPLTKDDISRFQFSLDKLIEAMREDNGFTGNCYPISPRLYFIGERMVGNVSTAFILALFPNIRSAEPHLLSLLARIPPNYQRVVVITLTLCLTEEVVYSKLRVACMFPVTIPASFGQNDFKINYLRALRKRLPTGVSAQTPGLTDEQHADYEEYGYRCRDRLHIPGSFPRDRSNDICLNGHRLQLGDSLFALLLRFVVELKKKKDGWVNIYTLKSDGIITDPLNYQIYSRLRTEIRGSLLDKDGKKFIESDRSKNYRVSTHSDLVTCDKERLLNHPQSNIRELAKKLP